MPDFTEAEAKELVHKAAERAQQVAATASSETMLVSDINSDVKRKILVIGTGDGGCNIASDIKRAYPEIPVLGYNTSNRGTGDLKIDHFIIPRAEDGSGKERSYSKSILKRGVYKYVLDNIDRFGPDADYIVITTTCDGGTGGGISPMLAKLFMSNMGIPVIVIGVYPALSEDARAQHNMLEWQKEIEDIGARYMIFDNNYYSDLPKAQMHTKVNRDIVNVIGILLGKDFGKTSIQAIDSRDMEMILNRYPGRIVIGVTNNRPRVGKTIGQVCVENCLNMSQPAPEAVQSYGLFIKGSKDFIGNVDTSAIDIRDQFGEGDMYTHLEISDSLEIALICGGCSTPSTRVSLAAQRYNEIMVGRKDDSRSIMDDIMNNLQDDVTEYHRAERREAIDLSALDL